MIVIDGSQGEGGGQIFRSSLTLAMCLGKPVQVVNIRAGRARPGLLRQHLTCLRAAQTICKAEVAGDELGSMEVRFVPGTVEAGAYRFAVGSAGSTSLVFQTLLLPLMFAKGSSELYLEGGTHNGHAPSYDYIEGCFLPAMASMGYMAQVELQKFGFYPAGGGAWTAWLHPTRMTSALDWTEAGDVLSQRAVATSAQLPGHITARELAYVQKKCLWSSEQLQQRLIESAGPGNIFSIQIDREPAGEVIEVVGERGLSAERVAGRAVKAMRNYLSCAAPVGEYLADQLLLPMALARGGRFVTSSPSSHLLSNAEVVRQIMGIKVCIEQIADRLWSVSM